MNRITVMVIGAAGGIGKVLCTLLAQSGFVGKLILNDIAPTKGMEMELNHMDKCCKVVSQELDTCDTDIDCILMPCGKPQSSPEEKRDDLFKFNANIFKTLMDKLCTRLTKEPLYVVIGNPVNSLTVVCAEILRSHNKFNPKCLIGFNELDAMRAQRLVADLKGFNPCDVTVPLIGGHSEKTITPILKKVTVWNEDSQKDTPVSLSEEEQSKIFDQVRHAGDRVLEAYQNRGTAILSTAYSAFRLTKAAFAPASCGNKVHYGYVEHGHNKDGIPKFMTVPFKISKGCIEDFLPVNELIDSLSPEFKQELFNEVNRNIDTALETLKSL